MTISAGIDFWTTNTSIWYSTGKWEITMVNLGRDWGLTDNTCIYYSNEEKRLSVVWRKWFEEFISRGEGRLITSPKRFLKSQELPKTEIWNKKYDLINIISEILLDFKKRLEKQSWYNIDNILVGRPIRFHDTNDNIDSLAQDRLKEAFKLAWFKNIEFQYEPIWAFNAHDKSKFKVWDKILVVDLGWGTSDFSVLEKNNSWINILWNHWIYVGWDDIDRSIILKEYSDFLWKWLKIKTMTWKELELPIHLFYKFSDKSWLMFYREDSIKLINNLLWNIYNEKDKILLGRLEEAFTDIDIWYSFHYEIEKWKIKLSDEEEVTIELNMFKNQFNSILTREKFNEIIKEEINKIRKAIFEVIKLSWLKQYDINKIVLNWGTTLIPAIKEIINSTIYNSEILEWNSLSAVWYWLTKESYERFK